MLIFLNIFTFRGGLPWQVSRRAWDVSTCKVRSVFLAEEVMPHVSRRHFCSQKASLPLVHSVSPSVSLAMRNIAIAQLSALAMAYPITYTSCGVEHVINSKPSRIVTMNQGATEFLGALVMYLFFYCSLLFLRIYRTHIFIPRASHYSSAGSCLAWVWQIIWLALHTLMMLSGHATPAPMPQFRFSLQLTPTKARSWVRTQISLWHPTNLPLGRPTYIPVAALGAFSAMRLSHPARDLAQSLELPYLRAGLSCMPRELVPSSSPMPVKIAVCDLPW